MLLQLLAEVLGFEFEPLVFPDEALGHLDGRWELVGRLVLAQFVLGDDFDAAVVVHQHVDVVPEHRRQRDLPVLGDLPERLEGILVDTERDRLVFVTHLCRPLYVGLDTPNI